MKLKTLRLLVSILLVCCLLTSVCACSIGFITDSGNNSSSSFGEDPSDSSEDPSDSSEDPSDSSEDPSDSSGQEPQDTHTHSYSYTVESEPTLVKAGNFIGKCTHEGCSSQKSVVIPELNFVDYDYETERESCEQEGIVRFKYTLEGQYFIFSATVQAGHILKGRIIDLDKLYDYDSQETDGMGVLGVVPSCSSDELINMFFKCEFCGINYPVNAKRYHKKAADDKGSVIVEPSCLNEGVISYNCERCGNSFEEVLPKSHNYDYTLVEESEQYILRGKCKGCGEQSEKIVENVQETTVPATCSKAGSKTVTCIENGKEYSLTKELPITNHKYKGVEMDLDSIPVIIYSEDAIILGSTQNITCEAGHIANGAYRCSDCGLYISAIVRYAHTPPEGATGEYECTVCHKTVVGE